MRDGANGREHDPGTAVNVSPTDDVVARGRRAIVRRKRLEDAADEYTWRSDPELAEFDASRPVRAPREVFERNWAFDYRFSDVTSRSFAIEDENGRHIGNVMYYNQDSVRREAEIGISIGDRRCWSRGYGSDALAALAQTLLASAQLERVYLRTLDWNVRAQRAFRKAGFVDCGTSWRDGHTFCMMEARREWLVRQTAPERRQAVSA